MNTNIRLLAAYTADIFDDYLAEIKLPIVCSDANEEEDRHSNENSAMLYDTLLTDKGHSDSIPSGEKRDEIIARIEKLLKSAEVAG